jgi:ABC-2 type transport system permease protein
MTFWEIFRFEIGYQSRRVSTWLYFAVLLTLTFYVTSELSSDFARSDGSFSNGPFIIAVMALLCSTIGLLTATALAGDAAARDAQTRIDTLVYTTAVRKIAYLGGRFLAAFSLYAMILFSVPLGLLLAAFVANPGADLIGPFRPAAYFGAYLFLLLPNAFVTTALMFSLAALSRRAIVSYLGGLLLLGACMFNWGFVAGTSGQWELAKLLDPLGATVLGELSKVWTPLERSTRLISLQGSLLSNRVLWIGIALGLLALTHLRFRLAHYTAGSMLRGGARWPDRETSAGEATMNVAPQVRRTFGFTTHAHQVFIIAQESFHAIVKGWGGLVLAAAAAFLVFSGTPLAHMGVPLFATTERITAFLAAPLTSPQEINYILIPLLIIFFAGQLVWRERETYISEIADVAPTPDWVLFLGKFVGLSLMLLALHVLLVGAGMLTQGLLGHYDFQIRLYIRTLFGLQFIDCLLFAMLAIVVHTLVNHKYVGHLAVVIAYAFIVFGPALGVEHNLLIYGSDPGWTYSDMSGFDPFIGPWLWFKLYWAGWALLLAIAGTMFWARGKEVGLGSRLALARRRFTRRAAGLATTAAALILALGGFIFYNTNILNTYHTASDDAALSAEYERRYGHYKGIPQPQLTAVNLNVEIYPRRRTAEIRGAYHLVNASAAAIDAIHLATNSAVNTISIRFDRQAKNVLSDEKLGHRTYALEEPLDPGESLRLDFEAHLKPRGFPNRGIDASVVANGAYFTNEAWLPTIGYQANRELRSAGGRSAYGLPARPAVPLLDEAAARRDGRQVTRIVFEAVVGTDEDQVAVAPGRLRRTWTQSGRRYFHYATDVPIRNDYAFFSAAYAVRKGQWHDSSTGQYISIEIVHHPGHAWNADRMIRSVQASLDYYTKQFGPYPHGQIRLVEHPGDGIVLHASPINISYDEGFSLLKPEDDPRDIDLPFAVVAHEVAHQWWGNTLIPARVEGAAVLTETLAWYSAMGVVERAFGPEHLQRLLGMMRQVYVTPRTRANVPLLRAEDWFLAYRKGPFAMYALREYVGAERINTALGRLIEKHGAGTPPLPTSLDLYAELQAVTPQSLRYLLVDLFEANTFWELAARRVTAEQTETGAWQVTLDLQASKTVVDTAGVETDIPMDDFVEVGVFAAAKDGGFGEPLYLRMHRIRSGEQRITVTVPSQPARAGIDPRSLLIDVETNDNLKEITRAEDVPSRRR